jgi:hypothetical protein
VPVEAPSRNLPRHLVVGVTVMAAIVIVAFAPAWDVFLAGDDFEWLAASYESLTKPLTTFEPINHFFRPMVKWTFGLDYLLFGQFAPGYMATNIAIHLLNVILLCLLMARHIRPAVATGCAAAFALSPLHSEAVLWASGRPDTLLLVFWLAAILLLDRWLAEPRPRTFIAFLVVGLFGAGAKETWVLFPLLATGFAVFVSGAAIGATMRKLWILWVGLTLYLCIFMLRPMLLGGPAPTHYAEFGIFPAVSKTSQTLLRFCGIGGVDLGAMVSGLAALLLTAAVIVVAVRTANGLAQWAIFWTIVTLAISAPFEFSVLRHNYLPLVGFWMVVAALADRGLDSIGRLRGRGRVANIAAGAIAVALLAVEGAALQLEIGDYRSYGEVHRQLYDRFALVSSSLPSDRPLILIDLGTRRAVEEVARGVRGVEKTFFVRSDALWQLVFLPPLAKFADLPFWRGIEAVPAAEMPGLIDGPVTLLLFSERGFEVRQDLVPELVDGIRRYGVLPPKGSAYRWVKESR